MTEAKFRSKVVALLARVLAFPVENYVADGVPDVCCTLGWIELKIAEAERTNGTIPIYIRPAQKIWLRNWRAAGQPAWVLTAYDNVGAHWIWWLHEARWACDNAGQVGQKELADNSVWWWVSEPTGDDLIEKLRRPL